MTISRRQFVSGAAGAGFATLASPNLAFAQGTGPVRIGLLAAKTGPLASGGIDMELALTMFFKEHDFTLAGRKVENRHGLSVLTRCGTADPAVCDDWP